MRSSANIAPSATSFGTLKKKQIIFHSDCVQTFGKIPIDVKQLHLDSISIASHKIYGPKGVGAVYMNPRVP